MAVIFPKKHANAIADGRVTQIRIPAPRKRIRPGDDFPVSGRGSKSTATVGRVEVLAEYTTVAGDITLSDARREGHRTTVAAKAAWVRRYEARWIEAQEVTTDPATGTVDEDRYLTDEMLAARFDARHAAKPVQVLSIRVLADLPRFLASQRDVLTGRTADEAGCGDYTTNRGRAIDELEAVDARSQARYAKVAAENRAAFLRDLEAERKARAAATPRGLARAERGRSVRRAA